MIDWKVESITFDNYALRDIDLSATLYGYFKRDSVGRCAMSSNDIFDDLSKKLRGFIMPEVKKVIFNDPATVICWTDGTKSVVKCQNDEPFDAEKGFVMAYLKKLLGNDNTFNKIIHKWVKTDQVDDVPLTTEELMKMGGQKVWLSSLDGPLGDEENFTDGICGWYRVDVNTMRLYNDNEKFYHLEDIDQDFGFRAYLRPQTGRRNKK